MNGARMRESPPAEQEPRLRSSSNLQESILNIHRVIRDGSGGNFLEPVRCVCRNRDHIAFGQMVRLSALNTCRADLVWSGLFGVDQSPASNKCRFTFDD